MRIAPLKQCFTQDPSAHASAFGAFFVPLKNWPLEKADLLVLLACVSSQRTVTAEFAYLGHKGRGRLAQRAPVSAALVAMAQKERPCRTRKTHIEQPALFVQAVWLIVFSLCAAVCTGRKQRAAAHGQ